MHIIPQDRETPATDARQGPFYYRTAYARSTDSRTNNETGQDYLTYIVNDQRFAFALCDGVSQSFYGDLAARILGEKLLEWVQAVDFKQRRELSHTFFVKELNTLTDEASRLVRDHPISDELSPMIRGVLEKKRAIGSESTFIAGLIDISENLAAFIWMGDSRLRLWSGEKELVAPFKDQFKTGERWSTIKGPVGELHLTVTTANSFDHLAAYSDGFPYLDSAYQPAKNNHPFGNHAINEFIADASLKPSSDDISFIEIWTTPTQPQFPQLDKNLVVNPSSHYEDGTHFLVWAAAVGATDYEVRVSAENQTTLSAFKTTQCQWQDDKVDANARFLSVRAWHYQEPGRWSEFLPIVSMPIRPAQLKDVSSHQHPLSTSMPAPQKTGTTSQLPAEVISPPILDQAAESGGLNYQHTPPQDTAISSPPTRRGADARGMPGQTRLRPGEMAVSPVALKPESPSPKKRVSLIWMMLGLFLLCGLTAVASIVVVSSNIFSPPKPTVYVLKKWEEQATKFAMRTKTVNAEINMTETQIALLKTQNTPAMQVTYTPTPGPIFVYISRESKFHTGPGDRYLIASNNSYAKGTLLIILGQSSDKTWYQVKEPKSGDSGWLDKSSLDLKDIDLTQIPVIPDSEISASPSPQPTLESTSQPKPKK